MVTCGCVGAHELAQANSPGLFFVQIRVIITNTKHGGTLKKCRTRRDIENDPRVLKIWQEVDNGERSYWVDLAPGYSWDDCFSLHESTIADLCDKLNNEVKG